MADRFEDLRNFVAIVEAGGVSAAAASLGIAKSAVSRRLADLEQRLGIALIDRSGRRFSLTAVGATVLADAQRVLTDLERLEAHASRTDHAEPLVVQADRDLLEVVSRAAVGLGGDMATTEVALEETVAGSQAHGALAFRVVGDDAHGDRVLGRFRRCVYAAAGTPTLASPAELRNMVAVSVRTAGAREWRFDHVEVAPRTVAIVPDIRSGLAAAAAGGGVVRSPEWMVGGDPGRLGLAEVLRPQTADSFVVATRASADDGRADLLIDLVTRVLNASV